MAKRVVKPKPTDKEESPKSSIFNNSNNITINSGNRIGIERNYVILIIFTVEKISHSKKFFLIIINFFGKNLFSW